MAKAASRARARNSDVFINCPFDDDYLPCFQALLFTVTISGYRARCALEENDAGDIRFDKLCRLIAACDFSVHDLSRIELNEHSLPRFNMPFELGLMMGAKKFGSKRQRQKHACIMTADEHVLPRYLSDLAGSDPTPHSGDPHKVIGIIRDSLHNDPNGKRLPGADDMKIFFNLFLSELPTYARQGRLTLDEVHARRAYRNFMDVLREFCELMRVVDEL